jgi:glycosyltransferase involved in cell wall biosynthesis
MASVGRGDRARIALVQEQEGEIGGMERVVACVRARYPDAALVSVRRGADPHRHFVVPLRARRFRARPFPKVDVALSFPTSGSALAVPPGAATRHIAYVCGAPRALHGHTADYVRAYPWLVRPAVALALPGLRAYAGRLLRIPDRLVAASAASAVALETVYGLRADVVHPPVRTSFFTPAPARPRHIVVVSRLVPHKRVDLVIDAFRGLDASLVVVGRGSWLDRLRESAPLNVRFAGFVTDEELRELYRASSALVCPYDEEFGIAMAEAQACGVPVIAPRAGGAVEIVRDGVTGLLLDSSDPRAIAAAVEAVARRTFSARACRENATRFSEERFIRALEGVVEEELEAAAIARREPAVPRTARRELRAAPAARR